MTINFDLDGTLCDLYGVENWLEMLQAENTTPYEIGKPLVRLSALARILNRLQKEGYELAIISWLCKNGSKEYNIKVINAKMHWLNKHLPSVVWDRISIIKYGTPKQNYCNSPLDILFDDEEQNRENWNGVAFDVDNIIEVLKTF